MQENPKPISPGREVAHVIGYRSFAAAGISLAGATATAEAAGVGHAVFAVGAVGSLLAMATSIAVHGADMLRCGRCMHQLAQSLQEHHAANGQAGLESAEPLPEPAELWPPATGVVPSDAWWAVA
jgi:hypothetical protein